MQNLAGKVAIISGASSGLGLAASEAFLAAGASVLGVDISPPPPIATSTTFQFYRANLTEAGTPKSVVAACLEAFGPRIDILLNIAGIMDYVASAATVKDDDWDRVIATNLTAPTMLMREVLQVMIGQKSGSIVNVSSKAGTSGAVSGVAYTASKHGLVGVTKNTAWLHKDDGIRCNAIAPGAVKTNINKDVHDPTKIDTVALSRMNPVHAVHAVFSSGEGVVDTSGSVNLMLFLASDLSHGVTGAIIPTDNAWSTI